MIEKIGRYSKLIFGVQGNLWNYLTSLFYIPKFQLSLSYNFLRNVRNRLIAYNSHPARDKNLIDTCINDAHYFNIVKRTIIVVFTGKFTWNLGETKCRAQIHNHETFVVWVSPLAANKQAKRVSII